MPLHKKLSVIAFSLLLLSVSCYAQKSIKDVKKQIQGMWHEATDSTHVVIMKGDTMTFFVMGDNSPKRKEIFEISHKSCDSLNFKSDTAFFMLEKPYLTKEEQEVLVEPVSSFCDVIKKIDRTTLILLYDGKTEEVLKR